MTGSLDSVEQKIFWSVVHAKSLVSELQRYFDTNPGKVVREPNSPSDQPVYTFQPDGPMPSRLGLIIGDCLQNLRSSLDYLVRELVLAAHSQPTDHEMFPICERPKGFKEAIKRGQLDGITKEALAQIEALQPYQLGKDWEKSVLWVLNEFTNINKHRRLLLTLLRATQSDFPVPDDHGGVEFAVQGTMPVFQDNAQIRPTLVPGKMEMKAQALACVTFDEGPAKGMEVSLCLNEWLNYFVNEIIPRFKTFF